MPKIERQKSSSALIFIPTPEEELNRNYTEKLRSQVEEMDRKLKELDKVLEANKEQGKT